MDDAIPNDTSQIRTVEVKTSGGNFLFLYTPSTYTIEIHRRGMVYHIKLEDLADFGRTSQLKTFRVTPTPSIEEMETEIVKQEFE